VLETLQVMAETPEKRRRAARKGRERAATEAQTPSKQGEPPSN